MRANLLKSTVFATAAALAAATTGCSAGAGMHPGMNGTGPTASTPPMTGNPDPGHKDPVPVNFSGVYQVSAPLDFTKNGVLPGILGPLLSSLSELHDHPGKALTDFIKKAKVLPSVVSGILSGLSPIFDNLISEYAYDNSMALDEIANIVMGITELTNTMQVQVSMTVHKPDAKGAVMVDSQLTGVSFTLNGNHSMVAFPTGNKVTTAGMVTPMPNQLADGAITIGDANMLTLPIGSILLQGMNDLLYSTFNTTTLGDVLADLVPCDAVGDAISSAVDDLGIPFVSIDSDTAAGVCRTAVKIAAGLVETEIKKLTFDDIKVSGISAKLYDVSQSKPQADHQSDRIAEGKWQWNFKFGGSVVDVPSTFAGDRVSNAN
jgi:hypothetical protein